MGLIHRERGGPLFTPMCVSWLQGWKHGTYQTKRQINLSPYTAPGTLRPHLRVLDAGTRGEEADSASQNSMYVLRMAEIDSRKDDVEA